MKKCFAILLTLCATLIMAQEHVEYLPFGDMDSWLVRHIKESALLGGKTRELYVIAPNDTIVGNKPYLYGSHGSPWGTSNAYAKIAGIVKAANSVLPEKRGNGYCCKMETTLQTVKAVGINLKALATGSIFTGKLADPMGIEGAQNPAKAIDMGMKFNKRPKALMLDIKAIIKESETMVRANASIKVTTLNGRDYGEIILFLQHRWEDENGNIYAYRVGTASERITHSISQWQNDHRLPVRYGNPTNDEKTWEALSSNRFMARNSKGDMVFINEIGYKADATPTHLILQISSGCHEPFTGCPGNTVWCDNIRLVY